MGKERSVSTEDQWVVGVDGSACSEHALSWATAHAVERGAKIQVVAAWQVPLYGASPVGGQMMSPADTDGLRAATEREARRMADSAAASSGSQIEVAVSHGGPSAVLLNAAESASLLVVGNRGRGGFSRLLLGSTSHQCATHAAVPTAIIPADSDAEATKRIVVGLDGSTNSLAALNWAIEFSVPESTIHVVWVWDASPLAVGADQFFFPEATDLAEERFNHLLAGVVEDTKKKSVNLTSEFVHGSPRTVLTEFAVTADLVVVGARGHGLLGSALLGSVSSWLLHHVARPLVVVPSSDASDHVAEAVVHP
jgi:nucleotide-binding universal stress UspA family protein